MMSLATIIPLKCFFSCWFVVDNTSLLKAIIRYNGVNNTAYPIDRTYWTMNC
jgi:hypothetical protein